MTRIATSTDTERDGVDLELALFALEAALLVASIVLVVHFRSTTATVFAVGAILVAGTVAAVRAAPRLRRRPRPGDYRATSRELFRVEKIVEDRALVEDCRTGVLVDIGVEELDALRLVTVRSPDREEGSRSVG